MRLNQSGLTELSIPTRYGNRRRDTPDLPFAYAGYNPGCTSNLASWRLGRHSAPRGSLQIHDRLSMILLYFEAASQILAPMYLTEKREGATPGRASAEWSLIKTAEIDPYSP
nr:hypothetical protein CFP56_20590 [Quercus suber]